MRPGNWMINQLINTLTAEEKEQLLEALIHKYDPIPAVNELIEETNETNEEMRENFPIESPERMEWEREIPTYLSILKSVQKKLLTYEYKEIYTSDTDEVDSEIKDRLEALHIVIHDNETSWTAKGLYGFLTFFDTEKMELSTIVTYGTNSFMEVEKEMKTLKGISKRYGKEHPASYPCCSYTNIRSVYSPHFKCIEQVILDKRLSWAAKGIFICLAGHNFETIPLFFWLRHSNNSKEDIQKAARELQEYGYIKNGNEIGK